METLFIADLHLSAERPEKVNLFKCLLRGPAREAAALYILGDLFEAWAGDDDHAPPHQEVVTALADYTRFGCKLYIMRGNRDFLLGQQFGQMTGGQVIGDETVVTLNGENILLMHGDTLCTEDLPYQLFRYTFNNVFSRYVFMLLPLVVRTKIWHGVRAVVKKTEPEATQYSIDVCQASVDKVMQKYQVALLIHGHTHRQAVHQFTLRGKTATRIVLGDWYQRDSILVMNEQGPTLMEVTEYLGRAKQTGCS